LPDHVLAPRNGGSIENADLVGHAGAHGRCAFMILYIRREGDRILAAKYLIIGIGLTIASGSMFTEKRPGPPSRRPLRCSSLARN
jgi:NifU-like protein involved in Fe-S cluster formation